MILYPYFNLFWQDSTEKQIIISYGNGKQITNRELFSEEFSLEESLCTEEQLTFGACESSVLRFKASSSDAPRKGDWLTVGIIIDGNASSPLAIGKYKVDESILTADREWREITAYDALHDAVNADVSDWYNRIFPNENSRMSMRDFRTSFMNHLNIQQNDIYLANDDMMISRTIAAQSESEEETIRDGEALSGADVLRCICEINGCFGHIDRFGKFSYVYLEQAIQGLYPSNTLYPSNDLYPREPKSTDIGRGEYVSCQYEDYVTEPVTAVKIRQESGDAGLLVGKDGNTYIIEGNFLVYGKGTEDLTQIANNLLERITKICYRPFTAECRANPCFEVGDPIRLDTTHGGVEGYILSRTIRGIQAMMDTYSSTGVEKYEENVNSTEKAIIKLKGKTNTLTRTLEETRSVIEDLDESMSSEIRQTADRIAAEVRRATEAEGNLSGKIDITYNAINLEVKRAREAEQDLSSSINMTAEKINLKVSKGDISSQLSVESGRITISGNRLVINSTNFQLDSSGNANFSGKLKSPTGKIGPFTITESMLTNPSGVRLWANEVYAPFLTAKTLWVEYGSGGATFDGHAVFNRGVNFYDYVTFDTNPNFCNVGSSTNDPNVYIGSAGRLNKTTKSTKRIKNSIKPVENKELDPHKILDIGVAQFKFNTDYISYESDKRYNREVIGFIAEDVAEKYPVAADYDDGGKPENWNARYIIPPMLALIQEQHEEIKELKNQVKELREIVLELTGKGGADE